MPRTHSVGASPDPGPLPSLPAPRRGETVEITVDGKPPYKDYHFSIRNPKHPKHQSFLMLRHEAIKAMAGRRWYDGPIAIAFTFYGSQLEKALVDYLGGIMDTLDGSHGFTFTYLPIVYQDDYQVVSGGWRFVESAETKYSLKITFL